MKLAFVFAFACVVFFATNARGDSSLDKVPHVPSLAHLKYCIVSYFIILVAEGLGDVEGGSKGNCSLAQLLSPSCFLLSSFSVSSSSFSSFPLFFFFYILYISFSLSLCSMLVNDPRAAVVSASFFDGVLIIPIAPSFLFSSFSPPLPPPLFLLLFPLYIDYSILSFVDLRRCGRVLLG